MKDITYYNKRCAEILGAIGTAETSGYRLTGPRYKRYVFDSDWTEQIPVWQKICDLFDEAVINAEWSSVSDEKRSGFRNKYAYEISYGTPETAFTILCQAIDFIDANGGEEGK